MPSNYENVSAIPPGKFRRTIKRRMRMERAARLQLHPSSPSIAQIANIMGVEPITVSQWRMDPAYHAIITELQTGVIAEDDRLLRKDLDIQREEISEMLPVALMNIRNSLYSSNERIRMQASLEVMDREGSHLKQSRTNVHIDHTPDLKDVNQIGSELAAMLALGSVDGFTITAAEAEARVKKIEEAGTTSLEDLDLSGSTPQ